MADSIKFDSPSVQARIAALRSEQAAAGVPTAELDQAINRANAVDGDKLVFSDVDLGALEQAVSDVRRMKLEAPRPSGFAPRAAAPKLTQRIDQNMEDDRRASAEAIAAGNIAATDIIKDAIAAVPVTTPPGPATEARNLTAAGITNTTYWGRVAPDGSFFAIGSNRGVAAFDLRPGHETSQVFFRQGSYDPTFARDALYFQGGGLWRASLDWLKSNPPQDVSGEVPGFVTRVGTLSLYQDVATTPDRNIAIDGYTWQGDAGPATRDPRIAGTATGNMRIHDLEGLLGGRVNVQTIATPFHTGFQLSLDGTKVVACVTDPANPTTQVGYAVYRIDRKADGTIDLIQERVVSGLRGGKPKMQGDYVTFHHAATEADFAMYGFASADDPAFKALLAKGTADIYLYKISDNTVRRLTNAGPGGLAWYPSFFQQAPNGTLSVAFLQQNANGTKSVMTTPVPR